MLPVRLGGSGVLPVRRWAPSVCSLRWRRDLIESPRKVGIETSVEMRQRLRNTVREMGVRGVRLLACLPTRDIFVPPRENAYPILDFSETAFDHLGVIVADPGGRTPSVRQLTTPRNSLHAASDMIVPFLAPHIQHQLDLATPECTALRNPMARGIRNFGQGGGDRRRGWSGARPIDFGLLG